mmetsp:Transcript_32068/g.36765  ORF Transcript_32068/g.36765 Transcript_32068/m.36765 type:complete len:421 (+) Transcript_32068:235-1497(+)
MLMMNAIRSLSRLRILLVLWVSTSIYTIDAFLPLSLPLAERIPIATSTRQFMIPGSIPLELLPTPEELATIHQQFPNPADVFDQASSSSSLLTSSNNVIDIIQSEENPFQYAFMFPVMIAIATCCQLAGIGGAALLSPVLLLIFPLLGPSYPLQTAASAIASALLTECFGFASGLSGYARRGLVDWGIAFQFAVVSMPSALLGAIAASSVASNPMLLRGVYATLMIGLALYLTLAEKPDEQMLKEECDISSFDDDGNGLIKIMTADGTPYEYLPPKKGDWKSTGITVGGSGLTGLLGVGVGEVILPQLVRNCCMPIPVAAGTSVAIVVVTALTAAVVQFLTLASLVSSSSSSPETGILSGLIEVVPWSLVQFTIPGALIGGQVAPYLASRKLFSDEDIEQFTAALFGIIGIAFGVKFISG